MRIIGIDPGLENTGFGIVNIYDDKETDNLSKANLPKFAGKHIGLLEVGLIKTSSKQGLNERLLKIYNKISKLISKHSLDELVLEKLYSHYDHPTTAILMGHARGVIVLAAERANLNIVSLSATKVKKSVTGRGNASKHQVSGMIRYIFNGCNIPDSYDITDALALIIADIIRLQAASRRIQASGRKKHEACSL